MLRCIYIVYIVCIYILCMLCCIYWVRYTVLIAICVYVLFYSGKEERLQPIARSLNYKSNQIKSNHRTKDRNTLIEQSFIRIYQQINGSAI